MYRCLVPSDGGCPTVLYRDDRGRQGAGDDAARLGGELGAHGGHLLSVLKFREARVARGEAAAGNPRPTPQRRP